MRVQLRSLDHMLDFVASLTKEEFARQYGGYYLVAMGLLSGEQIARGNPVVEMARSPSPLQTIPLRFDQQPRHITGQTHPLAGHMFHFSDEGDDEYLLVGRGESCNICVPDDSVSEPHCQLRMHPEGLLVVDLGSTNGTSINLTRLRRDDLEALRDGDMLTVGRYSFQLLKAPTLYSTLALIRALD